MPPSSPLKIATGAVQRLVKEEASYHKELEQQQARIAKLKQGSEDENAEYLLKQETRGVEETKAIFPELRGKIEKAISNLERELSQETNDSEDVIQAKEVLTKGKAALEQMPS